MYEQNRRLSKDVDDLKSELKAAKAETLKKYTGSEPGSGESAGNSQFEKPGSFSQTEKAEGESAPGTIEARVARIENQMRVLDRRADELHRTVAGGMLDGALGKNLSDMVAARAREEVNKALEEHGIQLIPKDKKPPIKRFAKMLELSEQQEDSVKQIVFDGQRRVLDLLDQPSPDGVSFTDKFVDALTSDEPGKKVGKIFLQLAMTQVPGKETTYVEAINSLKNGVSKEFETVFSTEQYDRYEAMGVDPLEIQIPDNPIEEYISKRLKERGETGR
jgi:hypothetical protein